MQCWVSRAGPPPGPLNLYSPLSLSPPLKPQHPGAWSSVFLPAGDDKFHAKTSPLLISLIENILKQVSK